MNRYGKGVCLYSIPLDSSHTNASLGFAAEVGESGRAAWAAARFLDELPARLIGDKAYDSDPLDAKLDNEYGIELIAPNRRGRKRRTQDGRRLRRYRKRWKVERLFAWMHNFRRLVTRWEYHIENFLGFVHLACLHILLRNI